MRLTAILLLAGFMHVAAKGHTQTITISEKNTTLEKIFAQVQKQAGYQFIYTVDVIQKAKPVDISVRNANIEQVLSLCFKGQPLSYSIIDKVVVVKLKTELPNADATNVTQAQVSELVPLLDISGKVTDSDGNPLSGATIKVKGSNKITTTNNEGRFVLNQIDNGAILEISFVGYETLNLPVNNRMSLMIALKLNVVTNPEVIINKGYYTEKQKTSVSNVGKVTADVIGKQPVQNVLLAAQGRVPGLFVEQANGNSGGAVRVRIQGQNSLRYGNDPLFIVDGVPIDAQLPSNGLDGSLGSGGAGSVKQFGSPLNYLNPLDIESIEVLKDADATAIYGSRAANGAILITTKKGKAGDMKLDANMSTGWGQMTRRADMMNTRQYLDMRYEAFRNDGIDWAKPSVSANDLKVWDTTHYTNWQDILLGGTARYNNINASVSGGSSTLRYLVSGTYNKSTTVFPLPSDFADHNGAVHFNLNANNKNQQFRMQFSGNYMYDDNQLPSQDMTQFALTLEPNAPPLLNADGSINWAPDANGNSTLANVNVMAQQYMKYVKKTYNLVSSLKLDYTILPDLNIGTSFGFSNLQTTDFKQQPFVAIAPEQRATTQRSAQFGDGNSQSWIVEPQASYRTRINKGSLDLLAGGTFENQTVEAKSITALGQLSDALLDNINAAATVQKGYSSYSPYRYIAFFGRANYNWQDKYILSANGRRDGSSRFGFNNQFHNFGSIGGAWIFSNEKFFKPFSGFVNFGKLRGSYGTTGNDQIGEYMYLSLYDFSNNSAPYQGIVGLSPAGLPNPNLEWEETKKLQLGIDLGFLQDKLIVNANYVQNRSSNQLLTYSLPRQTGFGGYLTNFPAVIQNTSWEFLVTGKIIQQKNFTWTASVNLTLPQNKLVAFPGLDSSSYAHTWRIGYPVDVNPYYHWIGVASGTGDYLYAQKDGHGTLNPSLGEDRTSWKSTAPKFYGGFQNSLSYKEIQLDFLFVFTQRPGYNDMAFYNSSFSYFPGMFKAGYSNQPVTVLDRWQKPGDITTVARFSTYDIASNYILSSDRRFTSISYVSLKNVSLSYELPQQWVNKAHFRNFSVFLHGQNLFWISTYKGLNPETGNMWSLPPLRVLTAGVVVGL